MTTQTTQTTEDAVKVANFSTGTGELSGHELSSHRFESGGLPDWTDSVPLGSVSTKVFSNGNGHHRSEVDKRVEHARAVALVDSACLYLLSNFVAKKVIGSVELGTIIAGPAGWLKICMLAGAGLVQVDGSEIRLTDDGSSAYAEHERIMTSIAGDDE